MLSSDRCFYADDMPLTKRLHEGMRGQRQMTIGEEAVARGNTETNADDMR